MSHEPKLTRASNGEWLFNKGKHSVAGNPKYKQFRLGTDRSLADAKAMALLMVWKRETSRDENWFWTEESIDLALAFADGVTRPSLSPEPARPVVNQAFASPVYIPSAPIPQRIMLHEALDRFHDYQLTRYKAHKIGERMWEDFGDRIKSIKFHIGDIPLAECDYAALEKMKDTLMVRPNRRWGEPRIKKQDDLGIAVPAKTKPKKDQPVAIPTVTGWLTALGMAFDWFGHPKSKIGWVPPYSSWRENFRLSKREKKNMLLTRQEEIAFEQPKPVYELDQLKELYRLALPRTRLYMLMGVCLGWTQKQISILTRSEIKIINGEMYIDTRRSKTGVPGFWWLCPELADLLRDAVEGTPAHPDDLALLGEEEKPLQHDNTDAVKSAWQRMMLIAKKKNLPAYSFNSFRRLAGQLMENISGSEEYSQLLLAHACKKNGEAQSVARTHYIGRNVNIGVGKTKFEWMHDWQREIHKSLKPVFDAAFLPGRKASGQLITEPKLAVA